MRLWEEEEEEEEEGGSRVYTMYEILMLGIRLVVCSCCVQYQNLIKGNNMHS